jgi:lipopolysaccharide/colanic/teichoic acid biosynthesis glycosyltransferase/glycosyltransferase involved in cell wall biosynthesis
MKHRFKVLQVTASDTTASKLLLPLIDRLAGEGYEVHIACSDGDYVPGLRERGYTVHAIRIDRCIRPLSNLRSLWRLYCLMKRGHFDIVHVHSPVAAVLGRLAARAARVPVVIYTAHGFYFHDLMSPWARRLNVTLEKAFGWITDIIFTQSGEDAVTAVKEGICSRENVLCIGNGVDVKRFNGDDSNGARNKLGFAEEDKVVGFVGRIVSEKGVLELFKAMRQVIEDIPAARLLLVGDTLDSDRDRQAKKAMVRWLSQDGLASRVLLAGLIEDVPEVMSAIDVLALPSYREGMPRTIIEAMASGKPVVATDIRGCREEVVHGSSGLLVPVKDSAELASAIKTILADPELARRMGMAGRYRALELFDERLVLDKQLRAYRRIIREKLNLKRASAVKPVQKCLKRTADIIISCVCLSILAAPFLAASALIKLESKGPVFFRQERIGRYGRPFRVWKFRTMIDGAVNHGLGLNVATDDPRLTRVGKVLRSWGLDELPQLVNVLVGEMSVVGPRPTLGHQVEAYNDFQRQRILVCPGITSLGVVEGRNSLPWKRRIRLDVWYIKHWSLWLDIKIIMKTFWTVLVTRRGIYGKGGINDGFIASPVMGRGNQAGCTREGPDQ